MYHFYISWSYSHNISSWWGSWFWNSVCIIVNYYYIMHKARRWSQGQLNDLEINFYLHGSLHCLQSSWFASNRAATSLIHKTKIVKRDQTEVDCIHQTTTPTDEGTLRFWREPHFPVKRWWFDGWFSRFQLKWWQLIAAVSGKTTPQHSPVLKILLYQHWWVRQMIIMIY